MSKTISIDKLIGKRFGRLILLMEIDPYVYDNGCPGGSKKRRFLCQCDCGKTMEASMSSMINGNTKSCGCYQSEQTSKTNKTHGMSGTILHKRWKDMKKRCYNAKSWSYKHYGGRGIKICDEWLNDFMVFYNWAMANGYKKELQLDRKDNNGNYCPDNCHFITSQLNCRNRRDTILNAEEVADIRNAYNLKCFSYSEIARGYGVQDSTIGRIIRNEAWI